MTDIDKPDEDANDSDDLGEHITKIIEFTFERGLLGDLGSNRLVNIANRSFLAGVDDDGLGSSIDDSGTLEIQNEALVIRGIKRDGRTEKSIFVISCLTALSSLTTCTDLFALVLSPVRIAWSTRKLLEETESTLQSAGILSPTATVIISPGTNSEAWIRANWEERRTLASSGEYSLRAYADNVRVN